ncbi:hypothetical protein VB713_27435 [Anabaena cylindrica UHCC 0172]|uniref:hypothetical protein n=1 Tax=Anabaena cylindrica TaxID=1165 RepID=UPI002B1EB7C1|nr:hypothetical protein [Anabaena cylindrica]MEA5554665.1 hypothetical protein [Anabaena cylindrica UHCC 0172]
MSTKELLIQEISSMSETELIETLNIIQSIKNKQSSKFSKPQPPHRPGSGKSILRHAGKWVGDDLKECLEIVQSSRGLAEF